MEIRPYQVECLRLMLNSLDDTANKDIVALATGLGKTVIFSAFVASTRKQTLILAGKEELLSQAKKKLLECGLVESQIDIVCQSKPCSKALVHIASVQTLVNRTLTVAPEVIIVDECHHATATTYQAILSRYPGAKVYGFTATPTRTGAKERVKFGNLFNRILYSYPLSKAIADGYLAQINYQVVDTEISLAGVKSVAGDFNKADLASKLDIETRNQLVLDTYLSGTWGKTLAFCASVHHCYALQAKFQAIGIESYVVVGETDRDERRKILEKFYQASLHQAIVILSCDVLNEGYDCPTLQTAFLTTPTLSEINYSQRIGRVTRLAPGKTVANVVDFHDHTTKKVVNILSLLPELVTELKTKNPASTKAPPKKTKAQEKAEYRLTKRALRNVDIFGKDKPKPWWYNQPISPKQIETLVKYCGYSLDDGLQELKKGEASILIDKAFNKR